MRQLKGSFAGRLRVALGAVGLCLSLLGASGCFPAADGYIYHEYEEHPGSSDLRLGAHVLDNTNDTRVVVFYQSAGGQANNFNTSKALLDLYNYHRSRGHSGPDSAELVMLNMRRRCNVSPTQYDRIICFWATDPTYEGDNLFLENALVPYYWDRSRCIAYRFSWRDEGESISRWGTVPNNYNSDGNAGQVYGNGGCRPQ